MKALVLKTSEGATLSWVRIPPSPPWNHSLKFLNINDIPKNIYCFCVGEATEKKAKSFGFYNAISTGGNVDALIELIIRTFDKKTGKLIYISSEFISKDLDIELTKKGYLVDRIVNYTSEPVAQIEQNTLEYIKQNKPDVICVYSEKSAINLKDLIGKYSLVDVMTQTNLMCLSKKISSVLGFIKWKKIIFKIRCMFWTIPNGQSLSNVFQELTLQTLWTYEIQL